MSLGALKKITNDKPLWDAYVEYLDSKIGAAHVRIEQSNDAEAMYRIQGEIAALRRLKLMREEVNGHS
jgi:hypothetical protein